MRWLLGVGLIAFALSGCSEEPPPPPDGTDAFVRCLQDRGGELVRDRSQLDRFPDEDVEQLAAAFLPSLAYYSVDAQRGSRRQTLVFVEGLHDTHENIGPVPGPELLRRARAGRANVRALILLPPTRDPERPIMTCEERAAPGQSRP